MEKARYGSIHGPLVDPLEFHARATSHYKQLGIFPYCDSCHEIVHLYGVHTPNSGTTPRFDHQDLAPDANPLDDCILANRNPRFRGLHPDGYDDLRGIIIRNQFFKPEFLTKAYSFCLGLCRQNNLPVKKFRSMIRRADKKRIWSYVGIQVWAIPYILLTLENFTARSKNGRDYAFHFTFKKSKEASISELWTSKQACSILKVFSSNGEPVQSGDNPYNVSEKAFIAKAGPAEWVSSDLLQALTC